MGCADFEVIRSGQHTVTYKANSPGVVLRGEPQSVKPPSKRRRANVNVAASDEGHAKIELPLRRPFSRRSSNMQAQIREIICEAATPPITMIDVIRGLPLSGSRTEHVFPTLTPAQIRRIAAHGHKRATQAGDVLVERGDVAVPFFVVVSGELEVLRPEGATDTLVAVHSQGSSPAR